MSLSSLTRPAEERIEGPDDRAGVQSGVEGIRLLTQQDEYVVGRGLRRVGRQERERSDYLIEGIAQTVEVGGRSVCSKYKVLSAAQYARPVQPSLMPSSPFHSNTVR